MVVMSVETYDKMLSMVEIYSKLAIAEKQIADGKEMLDADEVFGKLREKYVR